MTKMTKLQVRRMLTDIKTKTRKLWGATQSPRYASWLVMSTPDMVAIDKIIDKNLKRLG